MIVFAGDGMQNAALVEGLECRHESFADAQVVSLEQSAVPERVVEIPNEELYRLPFFCCCCAAHVNFLSVRYNSPGGFLAILICWIWVLPSMISVTLASLK